MIITVTPNPSVDRTLDVPTLLHGEVSRSATRRVDPGGKGINVARALSANGAPALAVFPSGGAEGDQLVGLLDERGQAYRVVAIGEPIRENITIVEPDGTVTKVNEPGPRLTPAEADELIALSIAAITAGSWVASCGRLPAGMADDFHARIVAAAHEAGAMVAVDTSGAPLRSAIAARPDLIKPNERELAEAAEMELRTIGDAVQAAQALRALGAGTVLVSLGPDGALLVDAEHVLHAWTDAVDVVSTVGAGDSTLAGYLLGTDPTSRLRSAVAFGAAAVQLPGTTVPGPIDVVPAAVHVTHDLELGRPLSSGHPMKDQPRLGVV